MPHLHKALSLAAIMTRNILILIFTLLLTNKGFCQKSKYYVETFSFNDTLNVRQKIFYYENERGLLEKKETYKSIILYKYLDSMLMEEISIEKHNYNNCFDTTKTIYQYNQNKLEISQRVYGKNCYKQREGCIVFENSKANIWSIIIEAENTFDINDKLIRRKIINVESADTSEIFTKYDSIGRVIEVKCFKNRIFDYCSKHRYLDTLEYVEWEVYNSLDKNIIKTRRYEIEKNKFGQIISETEIYLPSTYTEMKIFKYQNSKQISSIEYFGPPSNLYKVDKYYYENN